MDIFQMSLSASVLIVAVVIIRALTLHKLPKKTFLVLWGVVICRLFLPFSISSRFSFYTGIDMVKRMFAERAAVLSPAGIPRIPDMANMPSTGEPIGVVASATISPIEIVWLVGMCACALFFIMAYIKCRKEFKTSLPVENDVVTSWLRKHPLRRPVQIRQSDRIKAPLTYGVFHPVILLPKKTDWTDEMRLNVILTHELVHIRRFDTLIKLVLTAAVCVHWFNPLVWVMYVLANRDIELSCDETVVRTFGETIKSAYALTLIGLEEKKSHLTPLVNNFSKNAIEERIVSIMKIKKTSLVGIVLAMVLVVGTTTAFATSAADTDAAAKNDMPIEKLDRQMNEAAETQLADDMMMSYVNETDGKTYYSWDEGKTWTPLTDEEYEGMFPTPDIEWWTYDEYKAWLDSEKVQLQDIIGEKGWNPTDGWYVWTQEDVDEAVKRYEDILQEIKSGMMVSKSVDSDENTIMSYDPKDIEMGTAGHEYSISIRLNNGEEADFGPYSTKEEMLAVVKPYCEEQIKAKNMSQQEADDILSKYE